MDQKWLKLAIVYESVKSGQARRLYGASLSVNLEIGSKGKIIGLEISCWQDS